jgi:hypothetical protein
VKRLKIHKFRESSKLKGYSEGKGTLVSVHAMKKYRGRKGRAPPILNIGTKFL